MKSLFTCLMAMWVVISLHAQENTMIALNGNWKFIKGDNMRWARPGFNDKSWNNAIIPTWDWDKDYNGYGWFRKNFILPARETYFFNLGQVDDNCEVYFNGELLQLYISPRPKNDNADTSVYNQWKKYRSYYIPKKLVNVNKKNTIAIRVWDKDAEGGIRYGNIFVGNTVFYNQLPIQFEGNWLKKDGSNECYAGFYNNSVVYKGTLWNYGAISNKDSTYTITITNSDKTEHLVIAYDNAGGNCFIGPDDNHLQLCSLQETYEAIADASGSQGYFHPDTVSGKAHYSGLIKNYTSVMGGEALLEIRGPNNLPVEKRIKLNPDGSFAVDLDLPGPDQVYLRPPGFNAAVPAYVEPGKVTFQVVDLEEFKIYVTPEYYARERRTMYMGDLVTENKLLMYINWLHTMQVGDKAVWNRFMYIADQYATSGRVSDIEMNDVVSCIADYYNKYNDVASLKKAKIWAAKVLLSSPENHQFNSTFNTVLQDLGEHLEGLQYLVKALYIAEKDDKPEFVKDYKEKIKQYISDMLR